MADDKVKKRTVYCLSKKIPDENYDVYVGSTCKPLSQRLSEHKADCKRRENNKNVKLYKRMTEVGLENWKIVPLFEKTYSIDEIRKAEKKWADILEADLNTNSQLSKNVRNRIRTAELYERNITEKKYYCDVCEKAFQGNWFLNQHRDSLKHQFTFLNSLD